MKLVVGLGNPGARYKQTRHNLGRLAVECLAKKEGARFSLKKQLKASVASLTYKQERFVIACPETYMNLSGEAVLALVTYYKIHWADDLLVVVDDMAIPFESMRLRTSGSAGGHNGLKSIESLLGGRNYPRLRLGIGHPALIAEARDQAPRDYVLESLSRAEKESLPKLLLRAAEACLFWGTEDAEKVMSVVNS